MGHPPHRRRARAGRARRADRSLADTAPRLRPRPPTPRRGLSKREGRAPTASRPSPRRASPAAVRELRTSAGVISPVGKSRVVPELLGALLGALLPLLGLGLLIDAGADGVGDLLDLRLLLVAERVDLVDVLLDAVEVRGTGVPEAPVVGWGFWYTGTTNLDRVKEH